MKSISCSVLGVKNDDQAQKILDKLMSGEASHEEIISFIDYYGGILSYNEKIANHNSGKSIIPNMPPVIQMKHTGLNLRLTCEYHNQMVIQFPNCGRIRKYLIHQASINSTTKIRAIFLKNHPDIFEKLTQEEKQKFIFYQINKYHFESEEFLLENKLNFSRDERIFILNAALKNSSAVTKLFGNDSKFDYTEEEKQIFLNKAYESGNYAMKYLLIFYNSSDEKTKEELFEVMSKVPKLAYKFLKNNNNADINYLNRYKASFRVSIQNLKFSDFLELFSEEKEREEIFIKQRSNILRLYSGKHGDELARYFGKYFDRITEEDLQRLIRRAPSKTRIRTFEAIIRWSELGLINLNEETEDKLVAEIVMEKLLA